MQELVEKKLCGACGRVILRNLFYLNDFAYHYGCAKNTEQFGRTIATCLSCFSHITAENLVTCEFGDHKSRVCGFCGSLQLLLRAIPKRD